MGRCSVLRLSEPNVFVEIVRLFIVFLATAAGYTLGQGAGPAVSDNGTIIGATLGACVGYVAGGVLGRLLRQAMGLVEDRAPAHRVYRAEVPPA